jgi:hypothetical protein
MLELKRSLLNRRYILMTVLKALALIDSMCDLHVIFLSKITKKAKLRGLCPPRYFTLFTNGISCLFNLYHNIFITYSLGLFMMVLRISVLPLVLSLISMIIHLSSVYYALVHDGGYLLCEAF